MKLLKIKIMKFKKSEITKQIRSVLKMNDEEMAIKRIVEIIEGYHIARENTLIKLQDRKDMGY
jgi:hypothetical protein